jgi:adenylyltransferase/sulfurtransferase
MVPSCAEAGVLGVLPGIIGSIQAAEAIKQILGVGDPLVGRLLIFDALALRFREISLRRNPGCQVCGDEPTLRELVDYDLFCGVDPVDSTGRPEPVPQISPLAVKDLMSGSPTPFLLDVREPHEWEIGNLGGHGAHLIPFSAVETRLEEIPTDRPIVVYCHVGVRSALVVQTLLSRGFESVSNLKGGYLAWVDDVEPHLSRY